MSHRHLVIVGLGLIGGSVALAARQRGLVDRITAFDPDRGALEAALGAGAVDRAAGSAGEACREAALVVVSVPVMSVVSVASEAREASPPASVITDTASTKASIVNGMGADRPGVAPFVGGHPIAGTERSGFAAARADLFDGAPFVLTPEPATDPGAVEAAGSFWKGLGSRVSLMSPREHDRLFASISHLPHMAAYALVQAVLQGVGDETLVSRFSGGGFRDFTRIAASDPVMWRDICLDNRDEILEAIRRLQERLSAVAGAVERGDGQELLEIFRETRRLKERT